MHFFQIYQDALKNITDIKAPRTDRTIVTGSDNYEDYLAKIYCLRMAFSQLFLKAEVRNRYTKIGEEILKVILDHTLRVTICVRFIIIYTVEFDECFVLSFQLLNALFLLLFRIRLNASTLTMLF